MNKTIRNSLALAALLATAGVAMAQATSPLPTTTRSGEATTMQNGVPNPTQRPGMAETRSDVKAEAARANRMGETSKGEASTNVKGNPNMCDKAAGQNTRAAVKADATATTAGARNSNLPTKGGEASTTVGGHPNMATTGDASMPAPAKK